MSEKRIKSPSPDPILRNAPTDELKLARLAHLNEVKKNIETNFQKKGYENLILGIKQTGTNPLVITKLYASTDIEITSTRDFAGQYQLTFPENYNVVFDNLASTEGNSMVPIYYEDAIIGYITYLKLSSNTIRITFVNPSILLVEANTILTYEFPHGDYAFLLPEIKLIF
jgi:hypothetical protein